MKSLLSFLIEAKVENELQQRNQVQAEKALVRTMASTSKHDPSLKAATKFCGIRRDRITILPDTILIHILSFLPTEYAVRTCILSTRWKHIWASVPNLHFSVNNFKRLFNNSSNFADFIDRVLFFHESPLIHRFCLEWDDIELNRLNTWISVAIKRGVQELDFDVNPPDYVILPPSLWTSKTLVAVKLCLAFEITGPVNFPNLRVLHVSLQYPEKDIKQKLFCSSPVLEDLYIGGEISGTPPKAFNISTPALKNLEINFYAGYATDDCLVIRFVIDAPILERLTLRENHFARYRLKNVSSLVRADINVGNSTIKDFGLRERANEVYKILKGISNVEYLSLGTCTMRILDYADDNSMPLLFPNLTHLELRVRNSSCWKRLTYLLNCMPNLEYLVLEVVTKSDDDFTEEPNWIEPVPEGTPTCLLLHLERIRVTGFTSKMNDLKLIKYLLENAQVLIKLTINTSKLAVGEENEFLKRLVVCPRGSKGCTIELSEN